MSSLTVESLALWTIVAQPAGSFAGNAHPSGAAWVQPVRRSATAIYQQARSRWVSTASKRRSERALLGILLLDSTIIERLSRRGLNARLRVTWKWLAPIRTHMTTARPGHEIGMNNA